MLHDVYSIVVITDAIVLMSGINFTVTEWLTIEIFLELLVEYSRYFTKYFCTSLLLFQDALTNSCPDLHCNWTSTAVQRTAGSRRNIIYYESIETKHLNIWDIQDNSDKKCNRNQLINTIGWHCWKITPLFSFLITKISNISIIPGVSNCFSSENHFDKINVEQPCGI